MMNDEPKLYDKKSEEIADTLKRCAQELQRRGRYDLIMQSIGSSTLERFRIEAAKSTLSRLVITSDYRFLLTDYGKEVVLSPVHKAVYLLFLNHPEGIEFKRLADYREELYGLYLKTGSRKDIDRIDDSVSHLTDPLDNAINEKCSRIKKAFTDILDEYTASYYIISGRSQLPMQGSCKLWFRRLKVITLPRNLVTRRDV